MDGKGRGSEEKQVASSMFLENYLARQWLEIIYLRYPGDLFRMEIEELDLEKSEPQNNLSTSTLISNTPGKKIH